MFKEDKAFGDYWAEQSLKILGISNYLKIEGDWKPFDFVCYEDGKLIRREMKTCMKGHYTGNLAIEFKHRGNPSGITTSQADYWDYLLVKQGKALELYNIPTSVLKEKIYRFEFETVVSGGDDYGSKMYLFNKDVFKDYCVKVTTPS